VWTGGGWQKQGVFAERKLSCMDRRKGHLTFLEFGWTFDRKRSGIEYIW
jgi:hypothetical protein